MSNSRPNEVICAACRRTTRCALESVHSDERFQLDVVKALELKQIPGLVFGVQLFRGQASENLTICGLCQECTTKAGVMLKFQWQKP